MESALILLIEGRAEAVTTVAAPKHVCAGASGPLALSLFPIACRKIRLFVRFRLQRCGKHVLKTDDHHLHGERSEHEARDSGDNGCAGRAQEGMDRPRGFQNRIVDRQNKAQGDCRSHLLWTNWSAPWRRRWLAISW